jgi:hypothetical protein
LYLCMDLLNTGSHSSQCSLLLTSKSDGWILHTSKSLMKKSSAPVQLVETYCSFNNYIHATLCTLNTIHAGTASSVFGVFVSSPPPAAPPPNRQGTTRGRPPRDLAAPTRLVVMQTPPPVVCWGGLGCRVPR